MKNHKKTAIELPRLMSRKELCDRWSITGKTLHEKEKQGLISPLSIGRKKLYRICDILKAETKTNNTQTDGNQ